MKCHTSMFSFGYLLACVDNTNNAPTVWMFVVVKFGKEIRASDPDGNEVVLIEFWGKTYYVSGMEKGWLRISKL